jgi:hypothetical protein
MVNTSGDISTFAGTGTCGFSGDGGPAASAEIYYPYNVFVDSKNHVYIPDTYNQVVRVVTNGTITTIAGIPGVAGYAGDGGPATGAELYYPAGVGEDGAGNIYIADYYNHRIREVNAATGVINTVAGNGTAAFSGDGVAVENSLYYPSDVTVDVNGNFFIADEYNQRLRWVDTAGMMTTFAGDGTAGFNGDGGVATSAEMYYPSTIRQDSFGNFLVADQDNDRIRSVGVFAALNTSSGSLAFPLTAVKTSSAAQQVTLSAVGPLTINSTLVSGAFSESDDCPTSMPNATTCTMYVYFSPTTSGANNGTITFNTNGYFNTVSTISLTGTATAMQVTGAPVNFGSQTVKTTSAAKPITVKNAGTAAITMGAITLDETTDFAISANTCPASGATLAGGKSCTVSVTFTPQSTGAKKGAVIINDSDPTSPQIAGLTGTGTSGVALSPTSITFATTPVGVNSTSTKVTLTNNDTASITLGTTALTFSGPFVSASGTTCTNGLVVASKGTCIIEVQFEPTAVGYVTGTLSVSDSDTTSPQTVALAGTGTAVMFSPTSINFGDVTDGTQVSATTTLTNVGTTTLNLIGFELSGANSADFSYSAPCGSTMAAGATCTITIYFTPTTTKSESAKFKLFDNSRGSPQTVALVGTGQAAAAR